MEKENETLGENANNVNKALGEVKSLKRKLHKNIPPSRTLKETEVFIIEFISDFKPIYGVIKARYEDFHVNEIDGEGNIVFLTDLTIPELEKKVLTPEATEAAYANLLKFMEDGILAQINTLTAMKNINTKEEVFINVNELSKADRTLIHESLRIIYKELITSSTIDKDAEKYIVVKRRGQGCKDHQRKQWPFPHPYVHFVVYKENLDTHHIVSLLSNNMKLHKSMIHMCGIKDRRAKTTQRFSILKRSPRQIRNCFKMIKGAVVGNFSFQESNLELGDHSGNFFRLAIRHINEEEEAINERLERIRENGFINYYGLQRFGNNAEIPTYVIGIALLQNKFKLACELIMKPRSDDTDEMQKVREFWTEKRNSTAAFKMIKHKCIEKDLLKGFSKNGENDYLGALFTVGRNALLLYPHAWQSIMFNRIASRRIKEFGLQPIEGDLVYIENDKPISDIGHKEMVTHITEQDLLENKYTIFDVVLCLPGFDIAYPKNVVKTWYDEYMKEYEITEANLKNNLKSIAMPGSYRKLIVRPMTLSWHFRNYHDPKSSLILSDLDKLHQKKLQVFDVNTLRAVILEFSLPTSTYATMLVRELLKIDTSSAFQCSLAKYALTQDKHFKLEMNGDLPMAVEYKKEENDQDLKEIRDKLSTLNGNGEKENIVIDEVPDEIASPKKPALG